MKDAALQLKLIILYGQWWHTNVFAFCWSLAFSHIW